MGFATPYKLELAGKSLAPGHDPGYEHGYFLAGVVQCGTVVRRIGLGRLNHPYAGRQTCSESRCPDENGILVEMALVHTNVVWGPLERNGNEASQCGPGSWCVHERI